MDAPPVQYVTTSDGYNIAYSVSGQGTPFVLMPAASSHLQLNWTPGGPLSQWLPALGERFRLICYDGRGQGMSARGLGADYSMDSLLLDLEAIVENLQLDRFILMGSHAAGHAAITYAVRHAGRVQALILTPTATSGKTWPIIANVELARKNWEFFLSSYVQVSPTEPGRGKAKETLQQSVTQEDWCVMASSWRDSNIEEKLPQVSTPTLVLHPRNYLNIPVAESAKVAALILNARMVLTEGFFAVGDAASGIRAIDVFVGQPAGSNEGASAEGTTSYDSGISPRELEVLHLIAAGRSNPQIAQELVISLNTVQRHVSNILGKTGAANRTEAAGYARDRGLA